MSKFEIPGVVFPEPNFVDQEDMRTIEEIFARVRERGVEPTGNVYNCFNNRDFYSAMPEELRSNTERMSSFVEHSSRFAAIIATERHRRSSGDVSGLLGEEIEITGHMHANGMLRRTESGYRINLGYLQSLGINPEHVLFFRRTDASETSKPELYWTSDFTEVADGLTAEIGNDRRAQTVVLVASLARIHGGSGLIQDINDDGGMSVRQIESGPFDQSDAIFSINDPAGLKRNEP